MPILDFKEIPEAHIASGNQDQFELFCQEFLKYLGMKIISVPDRGADGGKDIICQEKRKGALGEITIKWLVSCKHKAHTGNSVTPEDETNISDRVRQHGTQGFVGFYSTILSSGLNNRLNSYKGEMEIKVFNSESIEEILLRDAEGKKLMKRFFPKSYDQWDKKRVEPSNLLDEYTPLKCNYCEKDIIDPNIVPAYLGMIAFVMDYDFYEASGYKTEKVVDIYWCCKGDCDEHMRRKYEKRGYDTHWEDISDLKIPFKYLQWVIANMNNIEDESIIFEEEAYEKLKHIIICVGQYVLKGNTEEDVNRIRNLAMIPGWA